MDDLNTFSMLADAASEAAAGIAPRRSRKTRKAPSAQAAEPIESVQPESVDNPTSEAQSPTTDTPTACEPQPAQADADTPTPEAAPTAEAAPTTMATRTPEDVHQRIGQLTRTLHDTLRGLGYDKDIQKTCSDLPDARDRLSYIARVTGEAADKVLNAVDRARSVQEGLTDRAAGLRTRWQAVAAYAAAEASRATPAGRTLIEETCSFFADVGGQADATNAILTDIMMAQDFHDLTGQVIRKVVTMATSLEDQLLKLLIETTPPEQLKKVEAEGLHVDTVSLDGPVVNAEGRSDVVTDQAGVDDLLASLGF